MICFVILHYMVLEETVKCIESIEAQGATADTIKIIVVDNASPNGTGQVLQEKYADSALVDVIINEENSGFARGNNLGYHYAKTTYNPDFMIVMNNDVELVSDNFYETLSHLFDEEQFFILSPDIYSTTYQLHQSPKRLTSYTKAEVESLHKKFAGLQKETLGLKVKCYLKSNKWLRDLVYKKRVSQQGIDFSKRYYNVPLHGSCVIVSSLFIAKEDELFLPETFFYYEMEILDIICQQKGYKTMYAPELQVHHHQNVSTNVVYNNMLKKTMFANKCNYESTGAFLKVFEKDGQKTGSA